MNPLISNEARPYVALGALIIVVGSALTMAAYFSGKQDVKTEKCERLGGVLARTTSGYQCVQPVREAA